MAFFDFLTSPKQDTADLQREQADLRKKKLQPQAEPFQDDEALRLSQHQGEEARAQQTQSVQGAVNANKSAKMAQQGLMQDYDRAVGDAYAVLENTTGSFSKQGAFNRPSEDSLRQVQQVKQAITKKADPMALADDFSRLSQNLEFSPEERKAFAGVSAMFVRASKSRDMAAASGEAPQIQPSPESLAQAQAKVEALARQEEAARQKLQTLGVTNPQRQATQNAVLELAKERQETERNLKHFSQQEAAKAAQPQPQSTTPPLQADIKKNSASGGRKEEDLRLAVVGAMRKAEQEHGLELGDLVGNEVDYATALRTMLPVLDPSGKVQAEMLALAMKQKQGGQIQQQPTEPGSQQAPAESDATLAELKMKQAERRALLGGLGQDPSAQNWLSAIVTILLSAAIGSERALRVMGYASRTNTLKYQLDILNQEIEEDMALLKEQRQSEREIKREAARRMTRQEDQNEQRKWELGKMVFQHQLIIKRNEQKGNPETSLMKKLSAEFQRSLGIASKYSKPPYLNQFGEWTDPRGKAEFERYMKKAAELDAMLREIGGTAEPEEGGVSMEDDE